MSRVPPPDLSFLEWPFFEEKHRALARELVAWCADELGDEGGELNARCRALVAKLGRGGWLRHVVPGAYGGAAERIDLRSLCLIRHLLAYHDGLADFAFAMQGLGSGTISLFGSEAQKAAYLPRVTSGERIAAFAMTEARSGSDVAAMEMRAEAGGGGWVLNGEKTLISNGGIADHYLVFARSGEAAGAKGISAFIVDADTPGLEIAERIEVIAPHPLARIVFRDCHVGGEALIGVAGAGFGQGMATLDMFRPTVGATALGFGMRALAEATVRAEGRTLFGEALSSNPIIQAKLADMVVGCEASALLIYKAAWAHDVAGRKHSRDAAIAKLHATEAAQRAIDEAVQIFGGLGVVKGVPVEALYREIRALRIYEGASEVQRVVIARRHLEAFRAQSG